MLKEVISKKALRVDKIGLDKDFFRNDAAKRIASRLQFTANQNVYATTAKASEIFLREIIANIVKVSRKKNDSNRTGFTLKYIVANPREEVRAINVKCNSKQNQRKNKERMELLKIGENIGKRRQETQSVLLQIRAAQAQEEEEGRIQTFAANEAARTALGDEGKYLKWTLLEDSRGKSVASLASPNTSNVREKVDSNYETFLSLRSIKLQVKSILSKIVISN